MMAGQSQMPPPIPPDVNYGTSYGKYSGNTDFSKYGISMPKQTGFKSQFGKTYNTGG